MSDFENDHADLPRWVNKALDLFVSPESRDAVAGDLLEEYREVIAAEVDAPGRFLWWLRQTTSLARVTAPIVQAAAWIVAAFVSFLSLARFEPGGVMVAPFGSLALLALMLAGNAVVALRSFRRDVSRAPVLLFGAVTGLVMSARYLEDVVFGLRYLVPSVVFTSRAVIAVFLVAGVVGAARSRSIRVGALVAMTAAAAGWVLSVGTATVLHFTAPAAPFDAEVFTISLVLVGLAAVMGTVGAMFGRGIASLVRPSRS